MVSSNIYFLKYVSFNEIIGIFIEFYIHMNAFMIFTILAMRKWNKMILWEGIDKVDANYTRLFIFFTSVGISLFCSFIDSVVILYDIFSLITKSKKCEIVQSYINSRKNFCLSWNEIVIQFHILIVNKKMREQMNSENKKHGALTWRHIY